MPDLPSTNPSSNVARAERTPIVLVHGIWDDARTLCKLEAALLSEGFPTLMVALTPNDGRAPLAELGRQVHERISSHLPADSRFSIVGFSMGGLVSRSYLHQFGEPSRLDTFISISSPHRGTWTAWLRNHPGICDMRPRSAFLSLMDADARRFSMSRWITLRTPWDLMILPSASSCLPWAENIVVPVPLHALMAGDRRVIQAVISALKKPSPPSDPNFPLS